MSHCFLLVSSISCLQLLVHHFLPTMFLGSLSDSLIDADSQQGPLCFLIITFVKYIWKRAQPPLKLCRRILSTGAFVPYGQLKFGLHMLALFRA